MKRIERYPLKDYRLAVLVCALTMIVFAGGTTQAQNAGRTKPTRPNVVLMVGDNVGYGDIGAYQGGAIRGMPTPRIDKLASEGLQLTHFLTEPGCTPSRAGLLLGRYAHRAGLGGIIVGGTPNTLQASEVTLGELFKSRGYATAIIGKWHLGAEKQSWPVRQGFDEYRVGVLETTDSTLYRPTMSRAGLPKQVIERTVPWIWEGDTKRGLRKVREYTVAYRRLIERDIAIAAVNYIRRQAAAKKPFFLYIGWTNSHYPSVSAPKFTGKSRSGPYGDAIMELDRRTGEVLNAIKAAGIEKNTIVIWLSDDGAAPMMGPPAYRGGSNGIYGGELGDGKEGGLRTPAIIKWPGRIAPRKSNEMVSIHDIFPTLARLIGAKVPADRPIDGVDQSDFFLGKRAKSKREGVITFIGTEIVAVRWRHFRIYPMAFFRSPGRPAMPGLGGSRAELNGIPAIYNIEQDPREEQNIAANHAWLVRPYLLTIGAYLKSLKKHPNPAPVNLTDFKPRR